MSAAADPPDEPAIACPRCQRQTVVVDRPIASACVPFPAMEALRCQVCGHQGTRVRMGSRVIVSWGAPIR